MSFIKYLHLYPGRRRGNHGKTQGLSAHRLDAVLGTRRYPEAIAGLQPEFFSVHFGITDTGQDKVAMLAAGVGIQLGLTARANFDIEQYKIAGPGIFTNHGEGIGAGMSGRAT